MSEPKAVAAPKAESPRLAALRQKAKNLTAKVGRTGNAEAKARATSHLEKVNAQIKKESKS